VLSEQVELIGGLDRASAGARHHANLLARLPGRLSAAIYSSAVHSGPGEPKPIVLPHDVAEPTYPRDPLVALDEAPLALASRPIWRRPLWIGAGVVVAALVAAMVVLHRPAGPTSGQRTPQLAAKSFVAAIDTGNPVAAKAASCSAFADHARAAAETGADPGISFALRSVAVTGPTSATAQVTERLRFPGSSQQISLVLEVRKSQRGWLVCGRR
jgi:hypothetical protein